MDGRNGPKVLITKFRPSGISEIMLIVRKASRGPLSKKLR